MTDENDLTPTTMLTQMGIVSCVPKLERGGRRGDFALNTNARQPDAPKKTSRKKARRDDEE